MEIKLEKIDISKLTYEDIKPGIRHFIVKEVGKVQNPNGSWKRITKGEEHFDIKALGGKIPVKQWTQIAIRVIEAAGDRNLLDAIIEHVRGYGWDFKAWGGIETYAAECLLIKAHKAWEDRGEFTPPEPSFSQLLKMMEVTEK